MNTCTSIQQSKRLLELGIDPATSDLFHYNGTLHSIQHTQHPGETYLEEDGKSVYCLSWSLSALMKLLPVSIEVNNRTYNIDMYKTKECYILEYSPLLRYSGDLFTIVYETVVQLLTDKLI